MNNLFISRFAFSVIWEITNDAEIVKARYAKSVIKSKVPYITGIKTFIMIICKYLSSRT